MSHVKEQRESGVHLLAWGALLIALVTLFFAGPVGVSSHWPPQYDSKWNVLWLLSTVVVVTALAAAVAQRNFGTRLVSSLAIAFGLLASAEATTSYFGNYSTYPWIVVGGYSALVIVGGLLARLRVLAVASTCFLLYWLGPMLLPGRTELPVTAIKDGLECRLLSVGSGWETSKVELRDLRGRDLSRLVDFEAIETQAQAGPLIGLRCWPARTRDVSPIPRGPKVSLETNVFIPDWARSVDVRLRVQRWPEKPIAEIALTLDRLSKGKLEARGGKYKLSVANVALAPDTLSMKLDYSGSDWGGWDGKHLRFVDERGEVMAWSEGNDSYDVNPPKGTKVVKVQLFDDESLDRNVTTFVFPGLSTPG